MACEMRQRQQIALLQLAVLTLNHTEMIIPHVLNGQSTVRRIGYNNFLTHLQIACQILITVVKCRIAAVLVDQSQVIPISIPEIACNDVEC